MAQRRKALALAGTSLGNILGIQKEDDKVKIGQSEIPQATMIGGKSNAPLPFTFRLFVSSSFFSQFFCKVDYGVLTLLKKEGKLW